MTGLPPCPAPRPQPGFFARLLRDRAGNTLALAAAALFPLLLLVALLMLRGTFTRRLAWLGVVTGVVGIASEVLRPVLGGAYAVYGVLLFVWLGWVAVALWRLAGSVAEPRTRD